MVGGPFKLPPCPDGYKDFRCRGHKADNSLGRLLKNKGCPGTVLHLNLGSQCRHTALAKPREKKSNNIKNKNIAVLE